MDLLKKNNNELKYNYVYFNSNYLGNHQINEDEYNAICLRDIKDYPGVIVVPCLLDYSSWHIRKLWNISNKFFPHISALWYPFLIKSDFSIDKPICFIVASSRIPINYLRYLKRKYQHSKFVKIHRDLVRVTRKLNNDYSEEFIKSFFDLRMSYDEGEAKKFGMVHFDEIESKIEIPVDRDYPLSDVFFAGKAKDRLEKIIKAYDIFERSGLKCDFYITGVPDNQKIYRTGIEYADTFIPYKQMLYRTVNSRCLLDINQGGANGYTSRILNAIMYNKKIIMDNQYILQSKYYDPSFIQLVDSVDDIDPTFVTKDVNVDFKYENDFSPLRLIYKIDSLL